MRLVTDDSVHVGDLRQVLDSADRSDVLLNNGARWFAANWRSSALLQIERLARHPEAMMKVVRGDNPELHPAIRLTLEEVGERHGYFELVVFASNLLPIPAAELLLDNFGDNRRKQLVQLVKYVDRSGVMRPFLETVRAEYPDVELFTRTHGHLHRVGRHVRPNAAPRRREPPETTVLSRRCQDDIK